MLKEYIKYKYDIYVLYIVLLVIEYIIFSLAHISDDLILYLYLIFIFIMIVYTIFSFSTFRKKHLELEMLRNQLDVLSEIDLCDNFIEKDYVNIINDLNEMLKEIKMNNYNRYNDMIEYYTMWVHQIKTPISALKLLIQTKNDNEMMIELLKIEQYVNMVLQYLRIDYMNNDFTFEYISLDHIVSEVLKKQVTFFSLTKLSLNYHIDDIKILTDEKWSSFVIEQILSNSLKYTKKGSISIYNDKEKLYIKDTGIGIRQEDLPRIFERGFTGINGRNDKRASGIGLYLSKTILDELGNTITVDSKINEGTTVCIDFYKKNIGVE